VRLRSWAKDEVDVEGLCQSHRARDDLRHIKRLVEPADLNTTPRVEVLELLPHLVAFVKADQSSDVSLWFGIVIQKRVWIAIRVILVLNEEPHSGECKLELDLIRRAWFGGEAISLAVLNDRRRLRISICDLMIREVKSLVAHVRYVVLKIGKKRPTEVGLDSGLFGWLVRLPAVLDRRDYSEVPGNMQATAVLAL
jgi:hypothetical protein